MRGAWRSYPDGSACAPSVSAEGRGAHSGTIQDRLADAAVSATFGVCRALAPVLALADLVLRPRRTLRVAHTLRRNGVAPASAITDIWFSRIAREAIRLLLSIGLARRLLERVSLTGNVAALDQGAVLASCHSPWGRLLAAWIARDGRVAVLATRRWNARASGAHEEASRRGMRRAFRRLDEGKCVAVTIDHFATTTGCRATVLRRSVQACLGAARIASRAGVPLVPVVVRHTGGRIEVELGACIDVATQTVTGATAAALAAFDRALHRDPSIWADTLRFASASATR